MCLIHLETYHYFGRGEWTPEPPTFPEVLRLSHSLCCRVWKEQDFSWRRCSCSPIGRYIQKSYGLLIPFWFFQEFLPGEKYRDNKPIEARVYAQPYLLGYFQEFQYRLGVFLVKEDRFRSYTFRLGQILREGECLLLQDTVAHHWLTPYPEDCEGSSSPSLRLLLPFT